jgi:nucleosome assembly protein 1-like 1
MIKIISQMPKEVQNRFKVLKVLSDQRSELADKFEQEIKILDAKIAALKKPLYEERRKIIAGEITDFSQYKEKFDAKHKLLEAECAQIVTKGEAKKDEEEIKAVDVENLKGKQGIPDFWFRAIKNNQMIYELVKEKDEPILKHLKHIETERGDDPKSLKVSFLFNQNEFFTNDVLSLKIFYKGDDDEVEKIEGTQITWNEGKDPTKKKVKKKQVNKKTNETRTIVKTVDAESFFNCFHSLTAPEDTGDLEEEEEGEL